VSSETLKSTILQQFDKSSAKNQPKRVQRKRTKGWQMPPNTVYVGRPTRWGNPYKPQNYKNPNLCLIDYKFWLQWQIDQNPTFLEPLRGKDLACWCPLDKPCHANVLLEFLREKEAQP